MDQPPLFDADLIGRYDISGPRYTSYPTAVQFTDAFDATHYKRHASDSNGAPLSPLSLYVHLPFCATVCFYCACTKVITSNRKRAQPYLDRVYRELALQGELYDAERTVDQLHWGGGTPTFLSGAQMRELMVETGRHFRLRDDDSGEYSIEIDPREADASTVQLLRDLGFNRMSLGVQDFDPHVQKAVNRLQSLEQTWRVLDAARAQGFRSISVDLIYGLPLQSVESFADTLDMVVDALPDRLSVFNYAHLPHIFKTQKQIDERQLPSADEKLAILQHTIEHLTGVGYVYIGMDHFARPDDELAIAQREDSLYRNFQGYSTHAECDLVAVGMSAISSVAGCYSQNARDIGTYCDAIDRGELAVHRGVELDRDDLIRRELITQLICHLHLDKAAFADRWDIDFDSYFAPELERLEPMATDGLLEQNTHDIVVLPPGRLLIRNICMAFDRYLAGNGTPNRFSRAI